MSNNFLANPDLFRVVLEDLPLGVYIVDQEQRIHFWNRAAEHIVGYLSHEVVGRKCSEHILEACDKRGQLLCGDKCPVFMTLKDARPQRWFAHYLHKQGHRVPVKIRSQAIVKNGEFIDGAIVSFEEAIEDRIDYGDPTMFGSLDPATGIPSHRLTRAVLGECIAGMAESRHGFGMLRVRLLGIDEFRSRHGPQSIIPFLRTTAHTLRHNLDPQTFLGRWGEDEFVAVLPEGNPITTAAAAETIWHLVTHSEVSWWGDRFPVECVVTHVVAQPGDQLEKLLNGFEPTHAAVAGRAVAAQGRI